MRVALRPVYSQGDPHAIRPMPQLHGGGFGFAAGVPCLRDLADSVERYDKVLLSQHTRENKDAPDTSGSASSPPTAAVPASFHVTLHLERSFRRGASWFYWIAGLSLVSSVILRMGGSFVFIFGLGLTQLIDAFAAVSTESPPHPTIPIQALSIIFGSAIRGAFAALGFLANRRRAWAFVVGMVICLLDALVLIGLKDWRGIAFHLFVLFGIYRGRMALRALQRTDDARVQPT